MQLTGPIFGFGVWVVPRSARQLILAFGGRVSAAESRIHPQTYGDSREPHFA